MFELYFPAPHLAQEAEAAFEYVPASQSVQASWYDAPGLGLNFPEAQGLHSVAP